MEKKKTYTINATPSAMAIFDERAKEQGRSRSGQFEYEARNNSQSVTITGDQLVTAIKNRNIKS